MSKTEFLMEGFHRLSLIERLKRVQQFSDLSNADLDILSGKTPFPSAISEHLIENMIGHFPLPLGVATHFKIDGKDFFIPMAVEESSIIAAASATAKWVKKEGSIQTFSIGSLIIGQVQFPQVKNSAFARRVLHEQRSFLIDIANDCVPGLVKRGGGVRDIAIREIPRSSEQGTAGFFFKKKQETESMLVLHIYCDPCDVMGANLVNQICEVLKPHVERLTQEKVGLCILSNLVDTKLVVAEVIIRGINPQIAHGIQEATLFAQLDPYRAATHNKGVLNGIDPILIATGNDWRAAEAGIHAYAARRGQYGPVTSWQLEGRDLVGKIEIPLAVGISGGVTRIHPTAQVALKILKISKAQELARICAAVGLIQNLGALKALSTVGIVKGHMHLHAANLAIAAGAEIHEIAEVRDRLAKILKIKKTISLTHAKEILEEMRTIKS